MLISIPLTFNFYNLASIHHLTVCVANSPCLQNVHVYVQVCTFSCQVCFFIDQNLCLGSGVRHFLAQFCAYAAFIDCKLLMLKSVILVVAMVLPHIGSPFTGLYGYSSIPITITY